MVDFTRDIDANSTIPIQYDTKPLDTQTISPIFTNTTIDPGLLSKLLDGVEDVNYGHSAQSGNKIFQRCHSLCVGHSLSIKLNVQHTF